MGDGDYILEQDARDLADEERRISDDAHNDDPYCEYYRVHKLKNGDIGFCNLDECKSDCEGQTINCKRGVDKVEKELVVSKIVMPAVSPDEAVQAFEAYQELAKKIMRPEDIQQIQGKDFKKKSFWRKCQRFFNLSIEVLKEERVQYSDYFVYKFVVRASSPNGAYMDGTGTCSSNEKGLEKTEHNCRAIAETRAKNRAISDLVAFGEVSAEEVSAHNGAEEPAHPKEATKITEKQRKLIYARWKDKGLKDDYVKDYMKKTFNTEHTSELNRVQMDTMLEWIANA